MNRSTFVFDLGDSNSGPIGMVVRVQANDSEEAVTIATDALRLVGGDCGQIAVIVPDKVKDAVESITIYVNPEDISEVDIYDEEMEADVDPS